MSDSIDYTKSQDEHIIESSVSLINKTHWTRKNYIGRLETRFYIPFEIKQFSKAQFDQCQKEYLEDRKFRQQYKFDLNLKFQQE
ncbi:unnamed protein product [Paramecium octaurelia]|uniref:Uncharacterized protein n=1 Tax=Paramecium octaurelia TaxID=43137 RepID=A0A8S1W257_PAROT|nr:unnamed protein product [Paramecium octaurelia]